MENLNVVLLAFEGNQEARSWIFSQVCIVGFDFGLRP